MNHESWHGAWCWHKVAARLRRLGHRVVTPDLPGHGRDWTPPAGDLAVLSRLRDRHRRRRRRAHDRCSPSPWRHRSHRPRGNSNRENFKRCLSCRRIAARWPNSLRYGGRRAARNARVATPSRAHRKIARSGEHMFYTAPRDDPFKTSNPRRGYPERVAQPPLWTRRGDK